MIDAYAIRYRLSDLSTAAREEFPFHLVLGKISNEITTLRAQVMLATNGAAHGGPVADVSAQAALLNMLLIAGRLYEAWDFLRDSENGRAYKLCEPHLNLDAKQARKWLSKYFSRQNLVAKLRNKAAFHWDRSNIDEAIRSLPEDDLITDVISPARGQTYYGGGFILSIAQMHNLVAGNDLQESLELIRDNLLDVAAKFQDFTEGVNASFLERHVGLNQEKFQQGKFEIEGPDIEEATIPYFVDSTNLRERASSEKRRRKRKASLLGSTTSV